MHRGETIELVQHNVSHSIALQFDDDAHTVAIGFIAQIGNAFDLLVAHQFSHTLNQRRLVHLIRNFRDDDRFTILTDLFDLRTCARHHRTTACKIGRANTAAAQNDPAGRIIRPRNNRHQIFDGNFGALHHGEHAINHFAQIMRRNIGGHANRNTTSTIDEQIGIARGQNTGFFFLAIVIGMEINRVFLDIFEQRQGCFGEARFRVTHGGCRIAVNRTEIALAINQRHAQRERLRHAHERVINRAVAVGMITTHHIADDTR